MRPGVCSIQIKTNLTDQPRSQNVLESKKLQLQHVSQRPTTLNLKKKNDLKNHVCQVKNEDISDRKPQVNIINESSIYSSSNPQTQNSYKNINTETTIQNPRTISSDLGKSEILVNLSVSTSSHHSLRDGTQRYQSTINVRPELPFVRNLESANASNNKSYTSVNLVLRQPSSNTNSPIDITVDPNLTYSSSSYHARLGYQNNYQITVTNECGIFSAFRIFQFNYNSSRLDTINTDACDKTSIELDLDSSSQNSIVHSKNSSGQENARKIIIRQQKQKERIIAALRKNKNKLSTVRKDVDFAMQTEINGKVSESLDSEIRKLRCDCQTMLNEIENSRSGLGNDSIQQTNSIKTKQAHSFLKFNGIPYPAPISTDNLLRNQQLSFSNEVVSVLRNPLIPFRHKNFNYGIGD